MPERSITQVNDAIMADKSMQDLNRDDPTEFESSVHKIYHAHGYDTEGKALPLAQQLFGKVARSTGIPESSIQSAASMVLPAAGTIAGIAAAPIAPVAGAMAGGYAGAKGNELLGITDPMSTEDSAMALASGVLGPAVSKGSHLAAKTPQWLPGASVGLHELAGETMKKSFDMARVTKTQVDAARAALLQVPSLTVRPTKLAALFKGEMNSSFKQAEALDQPELHVYADDTRKAYNAITDTGTKSFKQLMDIEGGLLKMKAEGSSEVWGKASGVLIEDLEGMVSDPKITDVTRQKAKFALDKFRNVVQLQKQYHAGKELDDVSSRVFQPVAGNTDLMAFNKKQFLKELNTNKTLTEAYPKEDLANMINTVEHIGYIGNMSRLTSPTGMLDFLGRSGAPALLGYHIGSNTNAGGQTGALVGFGAGALLASGLASQSGRNAIKYLAKQGRGKINAIELRDTLGQLMAGTSSAINAGMRAPSEGAVNAFENQQ